MCALHLIDSSFSQEDDELLFSFACQARDEFNFLLFGPPNLSVSLL